MVFHSVPFLWLVTATLVLHWGALGTQHSRNAVLLVASLVFYARWNPWLVLLVVATAVFDYRMALAIEAAPTAATRRARLFAAVAVPLGLLAGFEHTNFVGSAKPTPPR